MKDNICPPENSLNGPDLKKVLEQANCGFLYDKFDGPDTTLKEGDGRCPPEKNSWCALHGPSPATRI